MNGRRAFLKLSVQSMIDSVKEFAAPFIEDTAEKWERAERKMERRAWVQISPVEQGQNLMQQIVLKQPIYIHHNGELEAIIGRCPSCGALLQMRSMDQAILCLPCNIAERIGKDAPFFPRLRVKEESGKMYVEMRKPHA
ncbi:hypothetical protein [Aneurinibacillus terranovensis]|uniref:hypothetical protein n=1 Tax=Aneurinibacillus terranovensis TaxID=278991 RepID=UPI0003FCEB96|nr:hypothetical protein [Aneurinibacillus terranovensis]